jgi:hypothetical protein
MGWERYAFASMKDDEIVGEQCAKTAETNLQQAFLVSVVVVGCMPRRLRMLSLLKSS